VLEQLGEAASGHFTTQAGVHTSIQCLIAAPALHAPPRRARQLLPAEPAAGSSLRHSIAQQVRGVRLGSPRRWRLRPTDRDASGWRPAGRQRAFGSRSLGEKTGWVRIRTPRSAGGSFRSSILVPMRRRTD
jgi:hypothetical protein